MRFPDPRIVNRFLADYLQIRQKLWSSYSVKAFQTFKKLYGKFVSRVVANLVSQTPAIGQVQTATKVEELDDETAIKIICKKLKEEIEKAKNLEDWKQVILNLDAEARKAFARNPESLLGLTLHGMRTYILSELNNKKDKEEKESETLQQKIDLLRAKKAENDALLEANRELGLVVDDLKQNRADYLFQLAALGDRKAMYQLDDLRLTPYLLPDPKMHGPLTYSQGQSNPAVNVNVFCLYQDRYFLDYLTTFMEAFGIKGAQTETLEQFEQRAKENKPFPDGEREGGVMNWLYSFIGGDEEEDSLATRSFQSSLSQPAANSEARSLPRSTTGEAKTQTPREGKSKGVSDADSAPIATPRPASRPVQSTVTASPAASAPPRSSQTDTEAAEDKAIDVSSAPLATPRPTSISVQSTVSQEEANSQELKATASTTTSASASRSQAEAKADDASVLEGDAASAYQAMAGTTEKGKSRKKNKHKGATDEKRTEVSQKSSSAPAKVVNVDLKTNLFKAAAAAVSPPMQNAQPLPKLKPGKGGASATQSG